MIDRLTATLPHAIEPADTAQINAINAESKPHATGLLSDVCNRREPGANQRHRADYLVDAVNHSSLFSSTLILAHRNTNP